ncbi:MBL fold metallo-hydrolase [Salinibacterium hongtaonis]|uniref:MBL fold metallo-hydrolase n=1 Tax=Homoserinimonas hongtaonis TaxID=2079791 RepID=A0A2U1SWT3_9MICO|nr:MBL fold metallo-hydrolase [Salinibacterium hongtaonis]PWB96095.1 MBL fold metallo-hydrolase [Salinibacterium hongtaonis]
MKINQTVHRIGNEIVAAYLVVTPQGVTLIDAGLSGHWRDLIAEMRSLGLTLEDVRGLVLTHGDTDHIGFAERLRRETGVPVYVHSADAARARGEAKPEAAWGGMKVGAVARFVAYAARKGGLRTRYLTKVVEISDGQVLDLPGSPRVIGLPGHSPGSIAIHVPEADALFVGDALTTRHVLTGERGPQPAPFTDEPERAIESLHGLTGVEATWVLPGHGTPWSGGVASVVRAVDAFGSR